MYSKRLNLSITIYLLLNIIFSTTISSSTYADGSSIDKVYQPYVQPLEKEIEYRVLMEDKNVVTEEYNYFHKLGAGMAISEHLFSEIYVISEDSKNADPRTEAYELELRYQMTEQGEYDIDFGSMFELESYARKDVWEAKAGLLATAQWKQTENTANLFLIHEWGKDVKSEFESAFAWQTKYRYSPLLEPGFEMYSSQDTLAAGPMVMGSVKTGTTQKLFWHFGIMRGFNDKIPDNSLKLHLEYEFL